jgi:hypothetical protein
MLPTNLPPGTHLVTKVQNNNEDGYSPFLNYSDCSLTIEVIVCALFCWPHQSSFLLSQYSLQMFVIAKSKDHYTTRFLNF